MMVADKELTAIVKELKELNRRLDRLCRASIFSLDEPVIRVKHDYSGETEPEVNKD